MLESKANNTRKIVTFLLQHGARAHLPASDDQLDRSPFYFLARSKGPKAKELKKLVAKAPHPDVTKPASRRKLKRYWTSPKVQAWIGFEQIGDEVQCHTCLRWNDVLGGSFSACGQCARRWYCSRECQKKDWKVHKKSCKPRK
jgi:hypothetical protein